jgi:hypothetical protein
MKRAGLVALLAITFLLGCAVSVVAPEISGRSVWADQQGSGGAVQRWEHRCTAAEYDRGTGKPHASFQHELRQLGQSGWELVAIDHSAVAGRGELNAGTGNLYCFKRPL